MDSKRLSVIVTLAATTAILLAGAATLEGVTHHYTNGFCVSDLKIRRDFNNFLKSDQAKSEKENYPEYFKVVSDFVKNNGKGTLIATKEDGEEYFEFKYYENSNIVNDPKLNDPKVETFKNWQAVKQYLCDVQKFGCSSVITDQQDDELINQIKIAEENLQKSKQELSEIEALYKSMKFPDFYATNPKDDILTEHDKQKIEAKQKEYDLALREWYLVNSEPNCLSEHSRLNKRLKAQEAETRLYKIHTELYQIKINVYKKSQ